MLSITSVRPSRLFVSGLGLLSLLWAQNPQIQKALDKAGLKHTVDRDGDFKLLFEVDEGRTQLVFINSKTEEMGGQTIVEIWSPAYNGPANQDASVWLALLTDSQRKKVGAWQTETSNNQVLAIYKAKLPLSSLTPEFLKAVCSGVAAVADEVEKKMSEKDEF